MGHTLTVNLAAALCQFWGICLICFRVWRTLISDWSYRRRVEHNKTRGNFEPISWFSCFCREVSSTFLSVRWRKYVKEKHKNIHQSKHKHLRKMILWLDNSKLPGLWQMVDGEQTFRRRIVSYISTCKGSDTKDLSLQASSWRKSVPVSL